MREDWNYVLKAKQLIRLFQSKKISPGTFQVLGTIIQPELAEHEYWSMQTEMVITDLCTSTSTITA